MKKIITQVNKMNALSKVILHIGLPVISLLSLIVFIATRTPLWEPWYILRMLPSILEYLMMSLTLVIGGALLLDYAVSRDEENKK